MLYFSRKSQRKFYFTNDESKIFLGLSGREFRFIYDKYLENHEWRFRTFDGKEIFACLMLMIRSGQPQNFVHAFLQKYTNRSITMQALSEWFKMFFISMFKIFNHLKVKELGEFFSFWLDRTNIEFRIAWNMILSLCSMILCPSNQLVKKLAFFIGITLISMKTSTSILGQVAVVF